MTRVFVMGSYAGSLIAFRGALLRCLVQNGHDVCCAVPHAGTELQQQLAAMGVRYVPIHFKRTGCNPVADAVLFGRLVRILRELRPDCFLGYTIKPVIYGSLAAQRVGVPSIFSLITGLGYAFSAPGRRTAGLRWLVTRLYRRALKANAKVFFQNPDDRDLFLRRRILDEAGRSVVVNGSGIDIHRYQPAPFPNEVSFLLMARLIADKGIREYAEAARILRRTHPHIRFRLAGWRDENPTAVSEQELSGWCREGTIDYLGYLDDVRPAIRAASVYVLPSYREGTPRTVLEAMAMGRPVITTDVPGCRQTVVDGRNGYLVPARDAAALARAMERFIREPSLLSAMGRESRQAAVGRYDVSTVNRVMLEAMGLAS